MGNYAALSIHGSLYELAFPQRLQGLRLGNGAAAVEVVRDHLERPLSPTSPLRGRVSRDPNLEDKAGGQVGKVGGLADVSPTQTGPADPCTLRDSYAQHSRQFTEPRGLGSGVPLPSVERNGERTTKPMLIYHITTMHTQQHIEEAEKNTRVDRRRADRAGHQGLQRVTAL